VDGDESIEDQSPPQRYHRWIGGSYLKSLQIPIVIGRDLDWHDVHDRVPAVLVSERLAREYWGLPEAALGRRVAARPNPPRWHEIVGVVADVREEGMDRDAPMQVYWPQVTLAFWQDSPPDQVWTWRSMGYAVRSTRTGTAGFRREIEEAVSEVNPSLPILRIVPLEDLMARSMARTSFAMVLLCVAGAAALILGMVGVYGVISYAVSLQTREIGIRIALGANREVVTGMVLRQGLLLSVVGIVAGLALAIALTQLMSDLLYGIGPRDPVIFILVPAVLLVITIFACYIPAKRATRVDPMEVLRAE